MGNNFSQETLATIAQSRLVAIDLGYDHISIIHFFLADCLLDAKHSLRDALFKSEKAFQDFQDSCRLVGFMTREDLSKKSLPLTLEFEQAIKGGERERKKYGDKKTQPYHILLASTQVSNSSFLSILASEDDLYASLIKSYAERGRIVGTPKKWDIWGLLKKATGF